MGTLADLVVKISLQDELSKGLSDVQNKLNGVASNFRKIGAGLTAGVTVPLVAMGTKLVSAASDLNEAQSAVNTVFGDSANVITDFSKTSATAMGISQSAYLDAASGLGALFTGMGLSDKTSADFSSNILQNASDLASFYNTDPGTVLNDLNSGLVGEAEPLRKYGILLSEAAVQQKAMEQTGKANAKQLTESEKVTARYALIQEQLGAAQGDFARTSGGLANQQRILKARLQDTAAQMGRILLPYVLKAVKGFSDLLTRFQKLSPQMQKIIVIVAALAAALGPLLLVIGTLIPAITALIPLFGLLLGPVGLVVAAVALLSAAYIGNWWGFADAVNAVVAAFGDLIATDGFQTFLDGLETAVARPIAALKKMGEAIVGIGSALLGGDFKGAIEQAQKLLEGFGDFLASPAKALGQFLKGIETGFAPLDNVLHTVGKLATDWGRLIQEIGQGDLSGALDVAGRMFTHFGDLGKQAFELIKAGWNAINWSGLASAAASGLQTVGSALIRSILAGWDAAKPQLSSYASGLGSWVLSQITDAASALLQVGRDLIQGILSGWDEAGAKLDAYASGLTTWVFAQITDVGTALLGVGTGLIQGVLDGWDSLKGTLASYASGLPGWVFDQIKGAATALTSIGSDLVQGIIDGITAMAGQITDAIVKPVTDAINAAISVANLVPGVNIGKIGGGGSGGSGGSDTSAAGANGGAGSNWQSSPGVSGEINPQQAADDAGVTPLPLFNMQKQSQSLIDKLKGMEGIGTPLKIAAPDISAFTNIVKTIPQIVGQAMSDALSAATTYANATGTVVGTIYGTMVGNVGALMGQFTTNVGQGMSNALSAASTYSNAIYTVVSTNIGRMVGNVAALVGAVPGIVAGAMNDAAAVGGAAAYNAGLSIGGGLANGMNAMLPAVQAAANALAAEAVKAANATLKVSSPSKVFHQIGVYVGEGFANGIESRYAAAARAGNGLAESAIPGIGGSSGGRQTGRGSGFTNYGTIRVEAPSPEDFYQQWRQQQIGGVRR